MNRRIGLYLLILGIFFGLQTSIAREGPEDINRIQSLNITETDNETLITLTATQSINYTLFKMDDPPRVTVDFANANIDELKRSYSVDNGIVKNIKVITEVEGGLPISRIEINMEKLMDFSATAEGNRLLITISKITPYKSPETQMELEQEEQGLEGEIIGEPGAPEEGVLPEGMGEEPGAEIVSPEIGETMEVGALPVPEGAPEIPVGAPLPEGVEGETIPEELTEEVKTIEEGELSIEEEPTFAEGELPAGEEIPEAAPEVEAGAIAVAETPPEGETEVPAKGETIEGIIERSEIPPEPVAPEVVPATPEEKTAVIAQAPPPVEITPPPPPVPEKEEKKAWIKGNKIVTSEKIRFNSNEAVLPEKYEPIVQEIAKILHERPEIKIRIEGYTDSIGDDEFNRALSEYRAIWLKLLLERFGVVSTRIQVAGMGESNPIASNETEKGREKNRRVEFIIIQR